jgi:thioredoxin-dependent peroxiredoxin
MTSVHETASAVLKEGDVAPKFKLRAFPAGEISLDQFKGKKNVILAFYPKDDTPGCTKEMCAFSEDLSKFANADTEVLGISCDDVKSHEKFAGKFGLKQVLLADPEGKIGKLYGTLKESGTSSNRKLFVIDKQGVIRHIHEGMPTNDALLAVAKTLK